MRILSTFSPNSKKDFSYKNLKEKVVSTIPIPSTINKFSFDSNNGYIQLTNKLLIQWGRYFPTPWCNQGYTVKIKFPNSFSTMPFITTAGGAGGDSHPAAEKVTKESFETGLLVQYD